MSMLVSLERQAFDFFQATHKDNMLKKNKD